MQGYFSGMNMDQLNPSAPPNPLIGNVEALDHDVAARDYHLMQRDERMLEELRDNLKKKKKKREEKKAEKENESESTDEAGEDHYEPQRLTRKICWQYDQQGKKIPMFRRPYL